MVIWEVTAVVALVLVLYFGSKRRTSYLGEFIAGALYGAYWELTAEGLFNYTGFAVYVWRDIPLAMILLWGVSIAGFFLISDYLQAKYPISKKGKNKKIKNSLFWDIITATGIGWVLEYSGSHFLGMWTYPAGDVFLIAGIPWVWLFGWFMVGVLLMGFIRRYQELFEIKWLKNILEK